MSGSELLVTLNSGEAVGCRCEEFVSFVFFVTFV
jgi:hypothetical protein